MKASRNSGQLNDAAVKKRLARVERDFKRNHNLLVSWLAKKFSDRERARDIAQDAYLRVWRLAQTDEIDDARALIFKTAANLAANAFKAQQRHRANHVEMYGFEGENAIEGVADDGADPERTTGARQDVQTCLHVIENLPEKVRRAFILSRFEELTYRQIAGRLSISESSVEKYIIAALKELRQKTPAITAGEKVAFLSRHGRKTAYAGRKQKPKNTRGKNDRTENV